MATILAAILIFLIIIRIYYLVRAIPIYVLTAQKNAKNNFKAVDIAKTKNNIYIYTATILAAILNIARNCH